MKGIVSRLGLNPGGVWKLFSCSALCGVTTGLAAVAFFAMLSGVSDYLMGYLAGYHPAEAGAHAFEEPSGEAPPARPWLLALLPAAGGLLCGWMVYRFAPEAEGHGTDAAIKSYHLRGGHIRARIPLIKAISSAVTIGSGGSGGTEGPICQVGSGFGSLLGRWFHLSPYHRRILMAAGMAGGIGAMFRAPVAGALFAAEVLYRDMDMEFEVLVPGIISSVISYGVFTLIRGSQPIFATPDFVFDSPFQLFPYFLMALVVALGASMYIRVFYGVRNAFKRMTGIPRMLHPFAGGLLAGGVGFFFPQALGQGYGMIQRALVQGTGMEEALGTVSIGFLLLLFLLKILTTAFSIGSGGSGGVFGPALVAGSSLGGACGLLAARILPGIGIQPGAFALVGMAGFFAAAANTPLSTVIIVSEITGNYQLLVPSLWVCTIAYILARKVSIYENQMPNRFAAPVHQGKMASAIAGNITVGEAIELIKPPSVKVVNWNTTGAEILDLFAQGGQRNYPVVSDSGKVTGMVWGNDLCELMRRGRVFRSDATANELADGAVTGFTDESLMTLMRRMSDETVTEILVSDRSGTALSMLSLTDLMRVYEGKLGHQLPGEEDGYLPPGIEQS